MRWVALSSLTLILLIGMNQPVSAKDFKFEIQGKFIIREFDIGTVCEYARAKLGVVLMAESSSDTVHGHASALIEEEKIQFWIHLFEKADPESAPDDRPRFQPFEKRNSWWFKRRLKHILKNKFESISRGKIRFIEIPDN